MEAATRLQVFLDRAEFAPGKIDGRYGEFTVKALALYRQSLEAGAVSSKAAAENSEDAVPDVTGLDLASVDPVFISYTVTEADLQSVGKMAASVPEQAEQKSMPYRSAVEAIAEKFHADADFLAELNPGKTESLKAGDALTVPNVEPFELTSSAAPSGKTSTDDGEKGDNAQKSKSEKGEKNADAAEKPAGASVKVDTKTNMLCVYEEGKLVAAYPVTVGSEQTKAPVGEWKVTGVARMPEFRYDEAMLKQGERSSDFHMLPPGPNNPVGVVWIQLNKKGIGLHGTSEPDAIGRSESHGCIRLANWDVVRLVAKVKTGVPVSIN